MFCYQKNLSNPTQPVDEAQFWALLKAPKWNENIDKFRETHEAALKRKLPAFIFQATFDETASKTGKLGRWRKQSATRLTGLVVMDIDHVENPREVYDSWFKVHDFESLGILLVYVTPSGEGLKIVFKARKEWGNLIDNQHEMAKVLGVEVDESCKDASRMSFICKETDVLFLDNELFSYENKEYANKFNEDYRNGCSKETNTDLTDRTDGGMLKETNTDLTDRTDGRMSQDATTDGTDDPSNPKNPCSKIYFKGIPYSDIIAEWWKRNGGEPQEGERNVKLYQLAVNLRAICDNKRERLMAIMPRLGLDEQELKSIVDSACKEPPKGVSKMMREILEMFEGRRMMEEGGTQTSDLSPQTSDLGPQLWDWGEQIEALMPHYPMLRDICKGLKRNQYPAALFVASGLMMTLMTRCTYRFYHRPEELRRLNNSTLIIGDPASGKSFATRLFKLLASPIVAADQAGKDAINAYREQVRTKGANKEKPKKPKVVVRIHPARTSNAQFIQDMVNAKEQVDGKEMQLHMLTFDTELDNTLALQKGGAYIDKQALQLKAFHNEEDGQAYSNVDSVFQEFFVVWNYIYTGTPIALKRMVNEQNFGSGLATRLTCIPLPATNFEMMSREANVDLDSDERLKAWAEKLDKVKGELTVQKIVDELYEWTARRMEDAKENDSKADEMLLKRCAYHGVNCSAPFIVMRHWDQMKQDGPYWCGAFETDEVDWQLAELIVNMQYACQRHFFGAMAENYFDNKLKEASVNVQRKQKTFEAFKRLPEEFSCEDVVRCFNMSGIQSARTKVSRLMRDRLVEKVREEKGKTPALYRKTGVSIL